MTLTSINKRRDNYLRREYQVTLNERTKLLHFQKDACAICGNLEKDLRINLSMDHSHQSGQLRGLLCVRCNKALEMFSNNIPLLKAAIEYLTNPPFVLLFGQRYTAIGKVGTKARRKRLAKMRADAKEKEKNQ